MYSYVYIFHHKKWSPRSPRANLIKSKASWHQLPNWEQNWLVLGPYICSPASSHSPSGAKTSQMGVTHPATPKIYNFPAPNKPNSERTTRPPLLALFTCIYCHPQPLLNSPPYYTSPSSHLAPLASLPSYLLMQKTILLILTTPGSMAEPCFSPFLGGGQVPLCMYEVS